MASLLSNLPKITRKKNKRLGRGLASGKGAKSGRGTTRHQKARESIPLAFEGGQGKMIKKFPLLRGKGRNKSIRTVTNIVKIERLNNFKDGETVDLKKLKEEKIINPKASLSSVKVLANGKLTKKLTVKLPVSKTVKKIIEKLGGQVELP